ncbi:hypothetical protein CLAFUW4_00326 [Fulvia fulva]|nr:hypothetical protein CLAFUR4_00326 [Fulvia fulva]WPV08562.1 hypothetical protein CLAFUW4_00326 [Fulvia fulva]WPV24055.1 hypothetical protein CLAFUW7_00330 [Fulvia fulva]
MQLQHEMLFMITCLLLAATSLLPKGNAWSIDFYTGDKCGYSPEPFNRTTYHGPHQKKDVGNCLAAGDPRDGYDCDFWHDGGVRDDCTAPMQTGRAGLPASWFYPIGTICCVGFETLDECEWDECKYQPNLCIKGSWYNPKFEITEEWPFVTFYCYDGCPMADCEAFMEANDIDAGEDGMNVGP